MRTETEDAPRRSRLPYAAQLLLVAAGYYVAAWASLKLALVDENVTPFWPPTGIAVVGLVCFGVRTWPAIAAAALLVNLPISPSPAIAAVIAMGNTLAPLAAQRLLRVLRFDSRVARLRDALAIVFVALASALVSATVGSVALTVLAAAPAPALVPTWSVWWTGDAMGMLIVAPVLLMIGAARPHRVGLRTVAEATGVAVALLAASLLMLTTAQPVWVVVFPLVGLVAWRFQRPGAAPAALLVSSVATLSAVHDRGAFAAAALFDKMLGLQVFNAAVSLTALILAAVVAERARAMRVLEGGYEQQRGIAETLQRSLLPDTLPDVPGMALAARYVPATADVKIGGDWYDAVALGDGRLAVVIGDVAGHGVAAAATMAQLRMAARAYALDGLAPSAVLGKLNDLLLHLPATDMATVLFVLVDPDSGHLAVASAGHPPPMAVLPDASTRRLAPPNGPPVGVSGRAQFEQVEDTLATGETLVLFTDGLVERRAEPIDEGLDRLAGVAAAAPRDIDALCEHVLREMVRDGAPDDVAIVAIRRLPLDSDTLRMSRPASPRAVPEVRRALRRWLAAHEVGHEDVFAILVAACEACTNAIEHAYGGERGVVRVEASIDAAEVHVTVTDEGRWRSSTPAASSGGRGTGIMRGFMDSVDVVASDGGTEVRLRKRLRSRGAASA